MSNGNRDIQYIHSWSGGKDSTAAIILHHIHKLPAPTILFSELMFDKQRGISAEHPEHIDFIKNKALPKFLEWGYDVKILQGKKDYLDCFYQVIQKSKVPERNGKRHGFLLSGMCMMNPLKTKPLDDYIKNINGNFALCIGIAADEPKRLARLQSPKKSLLYEYGYTEQMAYDLCLEFDLLSPIYKHLKRGGCWFCPNATYSEFAYLKTQYPELWGELKALSQEKNLVSQGFKYGKTFSEIEKKVDAYLSKNNTVSVECLEEELK